MTGHRQTTEPVARKGRNGSVVGAARFLLAFATAVAAAVIFAWASQARQDEAIRRNTTAIAVLAARLDAICDKLDDICRLLVEKRSAPGHHPPAGG